MANLSFTVALPKLLKSSSSSRSPLSQFQNICLSKKPCVCCIYLKHASFCSLSGSLVWEWGQKLGRSPETKIWLVICGLASVLARAWRWGTPRVSTPQLMPAVCTTHSNTTTVGGERKRGSDLCVFRPSGSAESWQGCATQMLCNSRQIWSVDRH